VGAVARQPPISRRIDMRAVLMANAVLGFVAMGGSIASWRLQGS
jgi:hypothetical protein